jgi:thiol-disulfide isomerase/thioredoxin
MAPQSCSIGSAAPAFDVEVVNADGTVVEKQLSALRPEGHALVLDFFAPWCKSCPAAAKKLDELASGEYGSRCVFAIICVDGGIDAAKEFAAAHGIQKCVIAAVVDEDAPSDLYEVRGLPHHTLVDCQGVLVKNYSVEFPDDLDACLQAKPEATQSVPEEVESVLPLGSVSKEFVELELSDPLLMDNPSRWVMFPIQYPEVWEAYKKHEASFWTAEEIDIQQDKKDFEKLSDSEQHFVKHALALFAASDGNA